MFCLPSTTIQNVRSVYVIVIITHMVVNFSISTAEDKFSLKRPLRPVPQETLNLVFALHLSNVTLYPKPYNSIGSDESCNCGIKGSNNRIVGGKFASRTEWPWQAYLILDDTYECGGSLISQHWIVTAAHCAKDVTKIVVFLGIFNTKYIDKAEHITSVAAVIVHGDYDENTLQNDIALLRLAIPVRYSARVRPICLPYKYATADFNGDMATVTGWGAVTENGPDSFKLKKVTMRVLNRAKCTTSPYRYKINDVAPGMFCMSKRGADSCEGDSGGPVNWSRRFASRVYLIGVVSFGIGCAKWWYPGVYTKVNDYLDWIDKEAGHSMCKL